jgi:hypothetical protein
MNSNLAEKPFYHPMSSAAKSSAESKCRSDMRRCVSKRTTPHMQQVAEQL